MSGREVRVYGGDYKYLVREGDAVRMKINMRIPSANEVLRHEVRRGKFRAVRYFKDLNWR